MKTTTIFYSPELKDRWPDPLASEWRASYPRLFDQNDFDQSQSQRQHHFHEWLAAVYLFHQAGVYALLEKYHRRKHADKAKVMERLVGSEGLDFLLHDIRENMNVAPPDLLLYLPDYSRFWFAEVKGPNDSLSDKQIASHGVIAKRFNAPVEIIEAQVRSG